MARRKPSSGGARLIGASYQRQSLTRDGSESLESQLEVNTQTAQRFNVDLVATLIEPPSTSGYKGRGKGRAKFKELIELVESGRVQVVVTYKSDRLSRGGGPGWAPLLEAAEAAGLDLDKFVLTTAGFMSEFEIGIRATMDREESRKTGDRIADIKHRQALAGRPTGGGRRPLGYVDQAYSAIHEQEADIIREVRDRMVKGEPVQTIAKTLNARGLRTANGKLWSSQHLGRTMRSPTIAGHRDVDGELVKAVWPAIITLRDHKRLVARKGEHRRKTVKHHLLTGILRCGTCGSPMQSKTHTRWGLRYECRRRGKQADGVNVTGCVTITGIDAEYVVSEAALRRLESPTIRAALIASSKTTVAKDITAQLIEAKASLSQLGVDHYRDRLISRDVFMASQEALEEQIRTLESLLSRQRVTIDIPNNGKAVRVAYESGDVEFKRRLLSAVLHKVVIMPAAPSGVVEKPIVVPGKASGRPVDAKRIDLVWRA